MTPLKQEEHNLVAELPEKGLTHSRAAGAPLLCPATNLPGQVLLALEETQHTCDPQHVSVGIVVLGEVGMLAV